MSDRNLAVLLRHKTLTTGEVRAGLLPWQQYVFFRCLQTEPESRSRLYYHTMALGDAWRAQLGYAWNASDRYVWMQTSGMRGMQVSGMGGMQMSGMRGMQTSGMRGIQTSGIRGMQTSGMRGMQTSGMRGMQTSGIRENANFWYVCMNCTCRGAWRACAERGDVSSSMAPMHNEALSWDRGTNQ